MQLYHKMQPQNAMVVSEAQYQDHSMNPAVANIFRLQPVPEYTSPKEQSTLFRLEPVEPQRLDVLPPVVEPWWPWPLNLSLPTLVRACFGAEDNIHYCLKITCSQCCAVQLFQAYARVPTEDEIQQEKEATNNEFWICNGNVTDRVPTEDEIQQEEEAVDNEFWNCNGNENENHRVPTEDGIQQEKEVVNNEFWNCNGNENDRVPTEGEIQQEKEEANSEFSNCNGNENDRLMVNENGDKHDQTPGVHEGSKFIYLNPNAPEFYGPQAGAVPMPRKPKARALNPEPVLVPRKPKARALNPEAPPFFGPLASSVETEQKSMGIKTWRNQNQCVQNSRKNERRTRNRRLRQNSAHRNHLQHAANFHASRSRGYNSMQQCHQPQNQHVIPENVDLVQMFQDTTIQMLDSESIQRQAFPSGPGVPYGVASVPLAFCWTPEGGALHCMSASTDQLPSSVGSFNYR